MFGIGRLAAASILAIAVLVARVQAQDSSFMDMNMNMGCMLMVGRHEMQVSVYHTLTAASKELRDLTAEVRIVRGTEADPAAAAHLDSETLAFFAAEELSGRCHLARQF